MHDQDSSTTEKETFEDQKKGFWTIDRIVIYFVLAIAVLISLNDFRIRSQWESDYDDLVAAVRRVNTPHTIDGSEVDSTLVETVRSVAEVNDWLVDRGYAVDEAHSSEVERAFSTSSGIRTFVVYLDVHQEVITSVSREQFYVWNKNPENAKEGSVSEQTGGEGSRGASEMGRADGGASGGGARRNFDPEQIFADRDKDMDGLLTGAEISERMQSRVGQMDIDKDGAISKEEFVTAMTALIAASRQGGSGGGGGSEAGMRDLPDDPYAEGELGFPDANALPADIEKQKKERAANR